MQWLIRNRADAIKSPLQEKGKLGEVPRNPAADPALAEGGTEHRLAALVLLFGESLLLSHLQSQIIEGYLYRILT